MKRILRYLISGGSAFALDFGLLYAFRGLVGLDAWLAASLAFVISTVFAFYAQKLFTFGSAAPAGRAWVRYLLLLAWNTAMTAVVVQAFDSWWDLYLWGKVTSTAVTLLWNYPLMKYWVYRAAQVAATVPEKYSPAAR